MTRRSERFVLHFAILFLTVLLAMFALFYVMRANDGRPIEGGTLNFSEAFKVNLFIIDLALLLVIESLLVFLFVRYTTPALVISSAALIALAAFRRRVFDHETATRLFAPFVRNSYARPVLLLVLNAVLLAFLIAIMHTYHRLDLSEARKRAEPEPPKEGPPQKP